MCHMQASSDCRALKVIKKSHKQTQKEFRQNIRTEVYLQVKFAKTHQAPCVHSLRFIEHGKSYLAVIVMGKIDGILSSLLWSEMKGDEQKRAQKTAASQVLRWIKNLLPVLRKNNLVHGDLHWDNIGYLLLIEHDQFVIQPVLIDFGQSSVSKGGNSRLEVLQLMRTCQRDFYPKADRDIIRWMYDSLYSSFKSILRVKSDPDAIEDKHRDVWEDHMDQRESFVEKATDAIKDMVLPKCGDF